VYAHLFIAEKSSLAEEVANARAQQTGQKAVKGRGVWTVGEDAVCWLSGHMYEQAAPDDYDPRYKDWNVKDLPIVPGKWRLKPGKDRDGKSKADKVKEINGLLRQARNLVGVGDPGREGQLLVDEVLVEAGIDPFAPNVFRLWITDLSSSKKVEALNAMFPNAEKRNLYESALCRQRADWVHGLNMTRLYTVLARRSGGQFDKPLSVGRVQTPTLRLVVDRDREIEKFVAVDHYLPTGTFRHANGSFKASWIIPPDHDGLDPDGRLVDKAVAQAIADKVKGRTGPVESYGTQRKQKAPPLPYSLTALEKECSAKFAFPAKKTDEIAQALYETHKVASYPRTDCRHVPTGVLAEEAARIMGNLGGVLAYGPVVESANLSLKSGAWDDAKVAASDAGHYAIIPTLEATPAKVNALSQDERKVFDLIARAFIAQFHPNHAWDSTSAVVSVAGERFKATGRKVVTVGWKVVYGQSLEKDDDEDEDEQSLPVMTKGDPVTAEQSAIESKRTTPPSHFTEGTLVDAMENVHKFVPDSDVKKKLKANAGIGTTATRTATLEILKKRGFLVPKGKWIVSTTLGRSLIDVLDPRHKDPALTALWEDQLARVNRGELTGEKFLQVLVNDLQATVARMGDTPLKIAGSVEPLAGDGETCPQCNAGKLRTRVMPSGPSKGKAFLSCDGYRKDDPASCRYAKWPDPGGKPVKKLDGDGNPCPQCGKGTLQTKMVGTGPHKGKRYLSCTNWKGKDDPTSCRYSAWEQAVVQPLPGDGGQCPACGKGKLATVQINQGEHKGARFLVCSERKRDDPASCQYRAFPKPDALPGHGEPCPSCNKGKKTTVAIRQGPKKGERFMVCSEGRRDDPASCQWKEFPREKIEPLPREGELCEKCADGRMRTRLLKDGRRFLSCDGYRKDDERSCRHSVWPDDDGQRAKPAAGGKPGGGRAPAGKAGGKPAARSSRRSG